MPLRVIEFESTPNPNALKCHLDRRVSEGRRSFDANDPGTSDPVASRLMALDGVEGLMLMDDWLTIRKAPGASWAAIRRSVARALAETP